MHQNAVILPYRFFITLTWIAEKYFAGVISLIFWLLQASSKSLSNFFAAWQLIRLSNLRYDIEPPKQRKGNLVVYYKKNFQNLYPSHEIASIHTCTALVIARKCSDQSWLMSRFAIAQCMHQRQGLYLSSNIL